ncbi:phosphatase PAP2 family protein [Microbacterium paludicola]|uniref:acid phosphatase n=1 Tax=Microbacterium paludicola TaxID=300019 RepID=UPI003879AA51
MPRFVERHKAPDERHKMSSPALLRRSAVPLILAVASGTLIATPTSGADDRLLDDSAIAPHAGPHGSFIDAWATNTGDTAAEDNAAIGVLSGMYELWTPGDDWNTGVAVAPEVLDDNIQQVVDITTSATQAQQERAYVIDRRNQNFTAAEGLGAFSDAYAAAVNLGTTIPDEAPDAALTQKFDDAGNANGRWADATGPVGSTVELVEAVRGHAASSNPSKNHFQYARPYRWSDDVEMAPWAVPLKRPVEEAASDGGFPSGHTNAGHMAANALAYAFPQQFDELMLKAAEIGTSRIEVGMHSPLDVMGGRILSTAITAGALNDPALADVKSRALADAQAWVDGTGIEPTSVDYGAALDTYTEYLTFGFAQAGATDEPMRVPAGAEALIESRLPYLTDAQRRWVIHSTGLASGYPLNDDAEGWGRINLLAAGNGYGAFDTDVAVTMDAADGGFSASDEWKNDIEGAGSLTKDGSGSLTLSGDNAYEGGTRLLGGELVAASETALGSGDVANVGGTLTVPSGAVEVAGDYTQSADAVLELAAATDGNGAKQRGAAAHRPALRVDGEAVLDGTLAFSLPDGLRAKRVALIAADDFRGAFDRVTLDGVPVKAEIERGVLYAELR